jgi:hypothetical protein
VTYAGGHPSRLLLGRLLSGDLDESGKAGLQNHLETCPRCRAEFAKAEKTAALFAAKHPNLESLAFGRGRESIQSPVTETAGWLKKLGAIFGGGSGWRPAFGALALVVVAAVVWNFNVRQSGSDLTAKGGTHFYLVRNGEQVRGNEIASAPSDTLQLGIIGSGPVYYTVLYQDDGGKLSLYMGGEADQKPVGNAQGENLPHSLILDGGWGLETIFCVWADHPFTLDQAKAFVVNLPQKPGPEGLHAQVFQLKNIRI